MRAKLHVKTLDMRGARVLTRVDFNVPLSEREEITDDTRIRTALPTIRRIVGAGGKAVLMSHLGRPKGEVLESMRLRPAADRLAELLECEVVTAPDCVGDTTEGVVARMANGDVVLLENLRFHKGETKNEEDFSLRLSRMGDLYVNDAFGTAHRAHASTVGVTKHFDKRAMGYLIESELSNLSRATDDPARPFVTILGGAKVSDKIGVIENLMPKVDTFLIGGGMAFTFLRALGRETGESLLEEDRVDTARSILEAAKNEGKRIVLPVDLIAADRNASDAAAFVTDDDSVPAGMMGLDIGPRTTAAFSSEIAKARTIVWNGPLGVFEHDAFAGGTIAVAAAVAAQTDAGAVSIIGGGDSAAAIAKAGVSNRMTHISTGGGASLMFLEGKPLPGVEALSDAV